MEKWWRCFVVKIVSKGAFPYIYYQTKEFPREVIKTQRRSTRMHLFSRTIFPANPLIFIRIIKRSRKLMGGHSLSLSLSLMCQLCNFALVFFFFFFLFFPPHLNFERVEKNVDLSATSVTRFLIFDGGFAHFELPL